MSLNLCILKHIMHICAYKCIFEHVLKFEMHICAYLVLHSILTMKTQSLVLFPSIPSFNPKNNKHDVWNKTLLCFGTPELTVSLEASCCL